MKKMDILKLLTAIIFFTFILAFPLTAQEKVKLTGTVISIADGKPLKDINVRAEGVIGLHATTDSLGRFSMEVPSPYVTIVFTYPGFTEYTTCLDGRSDISVKLIPLGFSSNLDRVSLAFRTQQKRFIAESYSNLPDETFRNRMYISPEKYLTGLIPGVNVTTINGAPGAGANVNIRGITSIYGGNEPLYIVDGMEIGHFKSDVLSAGSFESELINVNNEDIESVTVLKDAAAKALYGAKGANGVIIIETYKGENGNSKIDFTIGQGVNNIVNNIPLLSADQSRVELLEMANSQYNNPNLVVQNYGPYLFNNTNSPYYQKYNNSTNWVDLMKRQGSFGNYHFRMRGGDDVSKYSFTLGLVDQNGIIKETDLQKLTARFNLEYNISRKLKYGNTLSFSRLQENRQVQNDSRYNPFYIAHLKSPLTAPYQKDENGVANPLYEDYDVFGISNPLAMINGIKNQNTRTAFNGNIFLQYYFTGNLSLYTSCGLDENISRENLSVPQSGIAPYKDIYRFSELNNNNNTLVDGKLEAIYNKKINYKHDIRAVLGTQMVSNNLITRLGKTYNASSDEFTALGQGTRTDSAASDERQSLMLSTYGNINYVYADKYIANVTMRVDGSSRFGIKNRFIGFPAIGLGWLINNEAFLRHITWIDELKLRVSYGLSGNDNIGDYTSKMLYAPSNYKNLGGVSLDQLANERLKPEIIKETDLGLDWSILNQSVNITVDAYRRISSNVLVYQNFSLESGYPQSLVNAGKVQNRGIEGGLNVKAKTGNLLWNFGVNLCFNANEVLELPESTPMIEMDYNGITAVAVKGQPLGTYYGYKTNGVFSTSQDVNGLINGEGGNGHIYKYDPFRAGDVKFVNSYKDSIIDEKDKVYLGKSMPDWFGGINASVSYKGFVLSALFDMQLGRKVVNGFRHDLESMSGYTNQTNSVNQRWRQSGDITDMPRLSYGDPAGNNRFSDRWVEDGSFVRLRTLSLMFNFSDRLLKKLYVKKLQVYINAENLITFTKYLGYDPEFNHLNNAMLSGVDYASAPLARGFSAGLRFGL